MTDLADAVVVGGGIAGAAIAYELAHSSMRVVLLESGMLGCGATGGSFAWVNATSKDGDEIYHRLNAEAVAHYGTLVDAGATRTAIHGGGALAWTAPEDSHGRERLLDRAARLQGWGYPVVVLNSDDMRALEPGVTIADGACGLYSPADRWLNTLRLVRWFADEVRNTKGEVRENCTATGFTSVVGGISTVETPQGRIATHVVVLAAGLQTPELVARANHRSDFRVPAWLRRFPGLLVETAPNSAPDGPSRVLYPPDQGGLHMRPTPVGGLLVGADDIDDALSTRGGGSPPPDSCRELVGRAVRHLPGLSAVALGAGTAARSYERPVPVDGLPIVGQTMGVRGVYALVTHSGVTLAPYLAHLLARQILSGREAPELAPYRPARLDPGAGSATIEPG